MTEINPDVRNKSFAQGTQRQIEEIIERDCLLVKEYYNSTTGFIKRLWQKASYHVINMILKVFTFYFKREFNKPVPWQDHL